MSRRGEKPVKLLGFFGPEWGAWGPNMLHKFFFVSLIGTIICLFKNDQPRGLVVRASDY